MNIEQALNLVSKVIVAAAPVVTGLESAKPFAEFIANSLKNNATEVTDAELEQLLSKVREQSERLQKPLSPE